MSKSKALLFLVIGFFLFNYQLVSAEDNFDEEEGEDDIGTVIGIDLGTTYSVVGVYRNGKVEIIANEQGERITPSYVAFTEDEKLVGESAKNQIGMNPVNTVYSAKRLIGLNFDEKSVQKDLKLLPYKIRNKNNRPLIQVNYRKKKQLFKPKEISAMVLAKMKSIAENFLGEKIKNAVVTVPAYFNDAQRKATKEAGQIAGLNVLRIINEPTAAAIAYGFDKKKKKESNVLVYDLGGGTFDVSILTVDGGVFEVKATNGDTHLGGEDFDLNLAKHLVRIFKKKTGIDLYKNKPAFAMLKKKCEEAKITLSSKYITTVLIESIAEGKDLKEKVSRVQFEKLSMRLFKSTLIPVLTVLADAKMTKADIDEIVLVGGSTRIPVVQKLLSDFFGEKKLHKDIDPDYAIAYGASVQAFILSGKTDDETKDMLLIDLIPLSLGIETVGGVHSKVIMKNTHIPTSKTQTFTTNENDQTTVTISVYQGEGKMVKHNKLLGKFDLSGIDKAPRGVPQIEVSFEIDANGIVVVNAKDKSSGKNNKIEINNAMADSPEDLKEMMDTFKKFEEEDSWIFNRTVAKNKLNALLNTVEKYKEDNAKKISKEDAEDLETLLKETRAWSDGAKVEDTEKEKYEEKYEEVNEVLKEVQTGESKKEEGENDEDEEEEEEGKDEEDGAKSDAEKKTSKGKKEL